MLLWNLSSWNLKKKFGSKDCRLTVEKEKPGMPLKSPAYFVSSKSRLHCNILFKTFKQNTTIQNFLSKSNFILN